MGALMHINRPYGGQMPLDTALDPTSNNPVRNYVIANAFKNFVGIELASAPVAVGDTTVSFTNSNIHETSELKLMSENSANKPVFWTGVAFSASVSGGAVDTVTYTFPALTSTQGATTFYLRVINDVYTPS